MSLSPSAPYTAVLLGLLRLAFLVISLAYTQTTDTVLNSFCWNPIVKKRQRVRRYTRAKSSSDGDEEKEEERAYLSGVNAEKIYSYMSVCEYKNVKRVEKSLIQINRKGSKVVETFIETYLNSVLY